MKQFIVLAAILPILLVFIAQSTLEGVRSVRLSAAEDAIRAFCIEASYFDGGSPAHAEALRNRLAQIFHCGSGDVYIDLRETSEYHIDWRVSFPVGDIMAGARLMGLSRAENRGRVEISGTIVVAPPPPEPLPPPGTPEEPGTGEPGEPGEPENPDEPAEPGEPGEPAVDEG